MAVATLYICIPLGVDKPVTNLQTQNAKDILFADRLSKL